MSATNYFEAALQTLRKVSDSQKENICAAAGLMAETIEGGRCLYAFGASHSFIMAEEMVYRSGGLMLVNPIYPHGMNLSVRPMTMTSRIERLPGLGAELLDGSRAQKGDLLILFSTSGRNAVIIDMALRASEKKIKTIAVTALAYTSSVTSRHSSGRKLADICDIVIDSCVPVGDAAVEVPGFPGRLAPLSSVAGCAIVNALVAETVAILCERGIEPPVFMSANVDGGDEYNARLLDKNADRIHYM